MAISKMKRVTFLAPRPQAPEFLATLQKLEMVHFDELAAELAKEESMEREAASAHSIEVRLKQIEQVQEVFDEFAPRRRGFLASMVAVPMRVAPEEIRRAVDEFDFQPLHDECERIAEAYRHARRLIEHARVEMQALRFFDGLPFEVADVAALRSVRVWIGSLNTAQWERLTADEWAAEHLAMEVLSRQKRLLDVCVVGLQADAGQAAALLRRYELSEMSLPDTRVPVGQRIAELQARLDELHVEADARSAEIVALSSQRRQVDMLQAHWTAELACVQALNTGASSKRVAVFTGYVRAADAPALERTLRRNAPGVSMLLADPGPDDRVPVALGGNGVLRPMSFLVRMFGLPDYFGFDPTSYLSFSFLLFFGICFSDVAYGLMLCGVAAYLAWKARQHPGLQDFCLLFLYGGISTTVFGVLSGSWASDLPRYLGENNFLLRLRDRTMLVDPLQRTMLMLMAALGIGVLNQLYGVLLKGYGRWRRGDVWGAVFDSGLWLVMIPAFLICVSKLFLDTPPTLFRVGAALFVVTAVALILTQGRNEKTFLGKAVVGVVSIYGIVGGYGCMAFTGDMLSYSRLLALGLTTSIVGMAVNIIANMLRPMPYVGVGVFVFFVIAGHAFNFTISILGAFVHSARLIFLEFFGRFYDSSGVAFKPLSLNTEKVMVTNPSSDVH